MRKTTTLIGLLCLLAQPLLADDGLHYWLTLNSASTKLSDSTKTKTHFEARFPDFDDFTYFRLSQKFSTKLSDKWSLGTHPVFERSKGSSGWKNTYRFDVELNPAKFKFSENGPTISMRNRWELRWKEGKGSEIFHRIRQQTKATWKVDLGPFTSYTLANEAFFEEDKSKLTINRFYPAVLGSKIGDHKISYYLLYQSKRSGTSSDWNGSYILGTSFSY